MNNGKPLHRLPWLVISNRDMVNQDIPKLILAKNYTYCKVLRTNGKNIRKGRW